MNDNQRKMQELFEKYYESMALVRGDDQNLYVIEKGIDYDPDNPRETGVAVGKIVTFTNDYSYADEKTELIEREWLKEKLAADAVIIPVYILDHSGIRLSVHGFADPWDSWQYGYIYADKKMVEDYGIPWNKEEIKKQLEKEIDDFDEFLNTCYSLVSVDDLENKDDGIHLCCGNLIDTKDMVDFIEECIGNFEVLYARKA